MNILKLITCLCICLLINTHIHSQNKQITTYILKSDTAYIDTEKNIIHRNILIPDHIRLQFAGAIGYISGGFGYNIAKWYEITFILGLQNETFGNSKKSVITTSIKNTFNLFRPINIINNLSFIPTAGLSLNWGFSYDSFDSLPNHYYFQHKMYISPYIGTKFRYNLDKKNYKRSIELYFELGTIDTYIKEYKHSDYVGINDIINLAIGVSMYFE